MQPYHSLIVGSSGKGKSTLLREIHSEFNGYSVVLNHTGEQGFGGRKIPDATTVRSAEAVAQAPTRRVNLQTRQPLEDAKKLRRMAHRSWQQRGVPMQIIVDEAQSVLPDYKADSGPTSGNTIRDMLHEDRDKGVVMRLATQDPMDLYYPPIKQCRYFVVVGRPSKWHRGFIDYFQLPREELLQLDNFEYVVMSADWKREGEKEIEYKGTTKERYA